MFIDLKLKKLSDKAILPKLGTDYAAGADLYALTENDMVIAPGETVMINTGIAVEVPTGTVGLIFARSGISVKKGLTPANKVGVIDSDYRGELIVALYNQSNEPQTVQNGERIAQFMVIPYYRLNICEVDELAETDRAHGGFGSTGSF